MTTPVETLTEMAQLPRKRPTYDFEVDVWWGSGHCDTYKFTACKNMREARPLIRRKLREVARRYTYDCGDLNRPLNPSVGNIRRKLHVESRYTDSTEFCQYLKVEAEYTELLIESDQQFINGQYNLTPAPGHRQENDRNG